MDFEVVWSGAHRDRDEDLLCCPIRLAKRHHVPVTPEEHVSRRARRTSRAEAIDHAAAQIASELTTWRTRAQLRARLDLSELDLKHGLDRLARTGRIESEELPREGRGWRQARHRLKA